MFWRGEAFLLLLITFLYSSVGVSCEIIDYRQEILNQHNLHRECHSAPSLQLDANLSKLATEWAWHQLDFYHIRYRARNRYGENIFATDGPPNSYISAVYEWYNDIQDYDFKNPGYSELTRHFSQLVWNSTQRLGVGVSHRGTLRYVVCNYHPPGNIAGQYAANVFPKKSLRKK